MLIEYKYNVKGGQYVTIGSSCRTSEGWTVYTEKLFAQKAFHHDRYEADNGSYAWWTYVYERSRTELDPVFVNEVAAEEGTYPDNGISGNYLYIKDRLAFPQLSIRVDNVWITAESGWCKTDSLWKEIDEININVNGVWKKSE